MDMFTNLCSFCDI